LGGPAVAIGFILLIPSIVGMIFSVLIFAGVIAYDGTESGSTPSRPGQPFRNTFDASFRQSCTASFRQSYRQSTGVSAPVSTTERFCECALAEFKETGSETTAGQTCLRRFREGSLEAAPEGVHGFYSETARPETSATAVTSLFRVIGSGFSLLAGVASFIGGLFGWLLVMRKRVLQCGLCGAVVNAS
jgi:hypothetical protein